MPHCIQTFTNTCEVTMQVKHWAVECISLYRQTTDILQIHVLVLRLYIILHDLLFVKISTTWLLSLYNNLIVLQMCHILNCPYSMQCRDAYFLDLSAVYSGRQKRHLCGVFTVKYMYLYLNYWFISKLYLYTW